jgi:hypothetical protein
MKLRNNNTREVKAVNHAKILVHFSDGTTDAFNSVKELTDKYSDYTEPLIKDEKIRKAVRAWAKANGFNTARYSSVNDCFCHQGNMMFIEPSYELEQLDFLGYKTIAELCGEEE